MGIYINPPNISKEEFLEQYCIEMTRQRAEDWRSFDSPLILLCYVQNPQFSALGIMYSPCERDAFTAPDPRPMTFFTVLRENIIEEKSGVSEEKLARYERF